MTITAYASATANNNAHVTQQKQQQQQQTTNQQRQRLRQSRARTKSGAQMTSSSTLTPLLKRAISAPQWIFLFILIYLATGECECVHTHGQDIREWQLTVCSKSEHKYIWERKKRAAELEQHQNTFHMKLYCKLKFFAELLTLFFVMNSL